MPVGFPVTAEPGTRALRPAGLSPAARISDSLRVWGLRELDATTPVAARTSHSWSRLSVCNPASRRGSWCTVPLLHAPQSSPQRKPGQVGWRPLGPTPNDSGDPECPVDQRLGVLGRSVQNGTEARTRRLDPPGPTRPLAATRLRTLDRVGRCPTGSGHRSLLPRIRTLNRVGWSFLGPGHRLRLPG